MRLFWFPLILLAAPAAAQSDQDIAQSTAQIGPRMIEIRHDIHRNPEMGNRETRTADLVARELTRLGLEVRSGVAHTGVVGILRGGRLGPVVAIRADMDGLPVTEQSDLPFKSIARAQYLGRETGVSHACGHDTHVAAQLGVANILAGMKDRLRGTVVFIFQPAEEGVPPGETGGAKQMVAEGVLTNPRADVILAFHANGSHGASPHLGVDAAVTASQIVLALQTIRSRTLSPLTPSVVTVGVMRGGDRHNIVPGDMHLEGTIRTFDMEVLDTIESRMRAIFDGITKAAGARFTLELDRSHPVTVNDTALTRRLAPVLARVVGAEKVREVPPQMGAEDFSYFAREIPGLYISVGAVPPGKASGGHHTPTFYADDGTVSVAMRVMTALVLEALAGSR